MILKGEIMKSFRIIVVLLSVYWCNSSNAGVMNFLAKLCCTVHPTQSTTADQATQTQNDACFISIKGYLVQTNCITSQDALRNYTTLLTAINNTATHEQYAELIARVQDNMRILTELNNAHELDQTQLALQSTLIQLAAERIPVDLARVTGADTTLQ